MKKHQLSYLCSSCGSRFSRWQGSCHSCGSWDSIEHSPSSASVSKSSFGKSGFGKSSFGKSDISKSGFGDRESLLERKRRGLLDKSLVKSGQGVGQGEEAVEGYNNEGYNNEGYNNEGYNEGYNNNEASSLLRPLGSSSAKLERIPTGIDEFDRVLGGGIVPGSVLLLGGDPGVGKSTLALQVAVSLSDRFASPPSASPPSASPPSASPPSASPPSASPPSASPPSASPPSASPPSASSGGFSIGSAAVYVSGEEDRGQLALRARRLASSSSAGSSSANASANSNSNSSLEVNTSSDTESLYLGYRHLLCSARTDIDSLLRHLFGMQERALSSDSGGYVLLVVDSIQTMRSLGAMGWDSEWDSRGEGLEVSPSGFSSSAGSLSSLRILTASLTHFARTTGIAVLLIGHVTKEGQLAGPKQIEHMVDGVLYLEGEGGHGFRLLRAVKNRFGSLDELGVFEMRSSGLCGVSNPSSLFLSRRSTEAPGTAVFASVEGTRPFLCEVQALVSSAPPGSPRRTALGWDSMRLATLLAVLEAHANLRLGSYEVYLNISGGLRVRETACDLAVACAIVSAARRLSIPRGWVFCGEIGLTGDIRAVGHNRLRAAEAHKLGFSKMLLPVVSSPEEDLGFTGGSDFSFHHISRVSEISKWLLEATRGSEGSEGNED